MNISNKVQFFINFKRICRIHDSVCNNLSLTKSLTKTLITAVVSHIRESISGPQTINANTLFEPVLIQNFMSRERLIKWCGLWSSNVLQNGLAFSFACCRSTLQGISPLYTLLPKQGKYEIINGPKLYMK